MKNSQRLLTAMGISLILFVFAGCADQVLNKKPETVFSQKDVWSDISLAQKYVFANYSAITWRYSYHGNRTNFSGELTDQLYGNYPYGQRLYTQGQITFDNMGTFAGMWGSKYKNIWRINTFFDKIKGIKGHEEEVKRLKGEMMFIRAYNYDQLINIFGGVPLVKKTFDLKGPFKAKRSSYQECVQYIVDQLNQIIDNKMVPETVPDNEWGRVSMGAVRALKSRVLLYAASKLHNPGAYSSDALYTYDKSGKWKDAADAAKAVIDMPQYSLVPVSNAKEYREILTQKNPELIFAIVSSKQYTPPSLGDLIQRLGPSGFPGANTMANPTQNLVDDFQMKDGKSISESPLYDPSPENFYKNKELRFYADINYNGAVYKGETLQFYLPGGKNSRQGAGSGSDASETGYSTRKYTIDSYKWWETSGHSGVPRVIFRLAAFYLNYAEAEYHLGNEGVAREYVNKIRERVHLPDIHSSGTQLLKDIRHERNIELCIEGHHFYDARRWMTAEKLFNEDAKGIQWKYVDASGNLQSPQDGGKLTYNILTVQERTFPKRQYFLPIPRKELERTDLKQNVGYKSK
jgi:hypothetical protein